MEIEENVAAAHLVVRLDFVLWPVNMIGKLIFLAAEMYCDAML